MTIRRLCAAAAAVLVAGCTQAPAPGGKAAPATTEAAIVGVSAAPNVVTAPAGCAITLLMSGSPEASWHNGPKPTQTGPVRFTLAVDGGAGADFEMILRGGAVGPDGPGGTVSAKVDGRAHDTQVASDGPFDPAVRDKLSATGRTQLEFAVSVPEPKDPGAAAVIHLDSVDLVLLTDRCRPLVEGGKEKAAGT